MKNTLEGFKVGTDQAEERIGELKRQWKLLNLRNDDNKKKKLKESEQSVRDLQDT